MAGRDIFKGDFAALVRCSFPLPIPIVLTGQRKLGSFKYFSVRSLFGENQISGKAFHLGNRKGACLYVSPHSIGAYRIRQFCRIIDLYASLIRVLHRQIIQLDRIVQRISKCPCNCSVLVLRVVWLLTIKSRLQNVPINLVPVLWNFDRISFVLLIVYNTYILAHFIGHFKCFRCNLNLT